MGKYVDLTGNTFGRLHVESRAPNAVRSNGKTRTMWNCKCDCGNTCIVDSYTLTHGKQISCGCFKKAQMSKLSKTHGMTNTRLYNVWSGIKSRCYNHNTYEYRFYGQRGIEMCDEWRNSFEAFYEWAHNNGYSEDAPRGRCTIDRVDSNGNYCPENCRFVTQLEQANNLRSNHRVEYNGETHTIAEWSRITGISQYKIRNRITRLGWSPKRALTTI